MDPATLKRLLILCNTRKAELLTSKRLARESSARMFTGEIDAELAEIDGAVNWLLGQQRVAA